MLYFGTLAYGPNDDPDGDGLTNLQEQFLGTNPTLTDTDGDLINDGLEYALGLDPLAPNTELTNAIFDALRGNLDAQRAHGLYTQESLGNLSIHPLIEITNEAEAVLRVRVQESTDLKEWNEIGEEVILTVPVNSDRQFFRLMAH